MVEQTNEDWVVEWKRDRQVMVWRQSVHGLATSPCAAVTRDLGFLQRKLVVIGKFFTRNNSGRGGVEGGREGGWEGEHILMSPEI